MASTWLQVQVDLEGGLDIVCDPPPGRVLIVGPAHTFAALAEAIDIAFARWDLGHLHVFELPDGREIGCGDDELEWLDDDALKVQEELAAGDEFRYTFDLGDDWRHRCRVLPEQVNPRLVLGIGPLPRRPMAIGGWGWIPDQYGRTTPDG